MGPDGVAVSGGGGDPSSHEREEPVGVTRAGIVYELFFTNLPQQRFTASDVVELYLHRGAFEPAAFRSRIRNKIPTVGVATRPGGRSAGNWSPNGSGTSALELGHQLEPAPVRITEFAAAISPSEQAATRPTSSVPASGYGPPTTATSWKRGGFSGQDFPLQPDGTLRCPAGQSLRVQERRREADGSLRLVYGASIRMCRPCRLRQQCQWNGNATAKPRQVSVLSHPLQVGSAPLLWRDWSRREHRRACLQLVRYQRIEVSLVPPAAASPGKAEVILSRPPRAHYRLSWQERLARNAHVSTSGQVTIRLFGVPECFATSLGLATA